MVGMKQVTGSINGSAVKMVHRPKILGPAQITPKVRNNKNRLVIVSY